MYLWWGKTAESYIDGWRFKVLTHGSMVRNFADGFIIRRCSLVKLHTLMSTRAPWESETHAPLPDGTRLCSDLPMSEASSHVCNKGWLFKSSHIWNQFSSLITSHLPHLSLFLHSVRKWDAAKRYKRAEKRDEDAKRRQGCRDCFQSVCVISSLCEISAVFWQSNDDHFIESRKKCTVDI